jgi:hypothetical protein
LEEKLSGPAATRRAFLHDARMIPKDRMLSDKITICQ